jgi:hypothetical protein
MLRPLSVSRVIPPTTTIAKTIAATINSKVAIARGRERAGKAGSVMSISPFALCARAGKPNFFTM